MVLKHQIKIITGIFTFLIMVFLFSCEKTGLFVDCSECQAEEPIEAVLTIKLSTEYGETFINIYQGYLEDSVLYSSIRTYSSETTITVQINKKYTLTAKYLLPGSIYYAVNSVTLRVKYVKDQCNDPCYYIYNDEVDLRLKYTK
ncbi:MAG: hypothetical protein NTZ85_10670 [Bacteroidia bacterium]|jgi:hypothetical protein|nr:hypothetical protein [Bacteroidia bacterium]